MAQVSSWLGTPWRFLTSGRFWIVLDQGKLSEYSNWKERLDLHMDPIDLRLASVREARSSERRFCFEVITPSFKRVYQATSEEDMNNWITAVNNALQSAFEGRGQPTSFTPSMEGSSSLRRDIGSVLTGKSLSGHSASLNHHNQGHTPSKESSAIGRRTTVGARPSYVRTDSNSYNENPMKLLEEIRARDAGNNWCADCSSDQKVEWVSINLGIVLCIECSGIHRSLGTHVSKVRSLTLDTVSFTHDIVDIIMQIGNRLSNQIWEARLDQTTKPGPQATRDQRLRFITDKYVERVFVQPLAMAQSHYSTPDDTLLASVKKDDIRQVLYALALKANPNAADRSRNTHAVFLALAAADPASPHPSTPTPAARSPQTDAQKQHPPAFPVAELLLQNGGEMPTTLPAFPLSSAAKLFFEQRVARNTAASSGDTLTALPQFNKGPGSPGEKETSKLQKRGSTGTRFGGRVPGV
jgi:Arf-GAP/SH3 domain/ANK repeat/PH domain-containing protein